MTHSQELNIENFIYIIRGHKVMLDYDLARLYGVETKALNQAVKRNIDRFPEDFMFQLTETERENFMRSQFVTAYPSKTNLRFTPHAFTEKGIAMLSGVLKSETAIQVHISIIRVFFRMREMLHKDKASSEKLEKLERNSNALFRVVFERLDKIEDHQKAPSPRRRIGF